MSPTNERYCIAAFTSFLIMISITGMVVSIIIYDYVLALINFVFAWFLISIILDNISKLIREGEVR